MHERPGKRLRIGRLDVEPVDVRLPPEPGQLPLGIAAGVTSGQFDRLIEREITIEMPEAFPVTQRLECIGRSGDPLREQATDLLNG